MQPSNDYTADHYYSYNVMYYMIKLYLTAKRNRDSHLQQELAKALHLLSTKQLLVGGAILFAIMIIAD